MPPRRSTRARDSSYESPTPPPATRSKRRGGPTPRDSPPKKTRTSERLRSVEPSSTPKLRATRSTSVSTVVKTPSTSDIAPPKPRIMARRTGGRPMAAQPAATQRAGTEFDIIVPTRTRAAPSEERDELDEDDADEEAALASRRARQRAARTRRSRVTEVDEEEEDEEDDGDFELVDTVSSGASEGEAGPGPRTTRNRRRLRPVPQPSPSVFRKLAKENVPPASQDESIDDPDFSPDSSLGPETQVEQPSKKRGLVGGTEMEIFDDDEDDDEERQRTPSQPVALEGQHTCNWRGCGVALATAAGLVAHIREHHASPAAAARRHSAAPSAGALSSQGGDGSRTLDFLTGELETARIQNADYKSQLSRAKAENDDLRNSSKTNESVRAQALIDAQAEFDKKLADALAESEGKLAAANKELDNFREELDKRVEEAAELDAMCKATEAELMVRNTTIDELQAKVDELQAKNGAASGEADAREKTTATLPADAPAEAKIKERDDIIADLRKDLKRSKKAHKTTKGDLDFIRAQYEAASSSAVQEVNRAKELEADVAKLREQLTLGLKQRDLFNKAAMDMATRDADKAQQQVNLLLEQSRRTDDGIRRKAAQYHQLNKERQQLEIDLHKERDRAHELSKRNDELMTHNAELRGRLMGAFDKVDEDDEDDDEPAAYPMPTLVPDDDRDAVAVLDPTLAGEALVWQCKWLVGNRLCGLYFDSREELDGHGQGVHISALEQS